LLKVLGAFVPPKKCVYFYSARRSPDAESPETLQHQAFALHQGAQNLEQFVLGIGKQVVPEGETDQVLSFQAIRRSGLNGKWL
jgi:hypothetical protein